MLFLKDYQLGSIPLAAIGYTLISTSIFTILHGMVRMLSSSVHSLEIAFFGMLFAALTYLPWIIQSGGETLSTQRLGGHFLRSIFNALAVMTWFGALALVPLAEATAVHLSTPIFLTIGAFFILREKVPLRRWAAVGIGIVGTLVIIRPGLETFNLGMGLVLVSALCSAGSWVVAKSLADTGDSASAVFYLTTSMAGLTLIPAMFVWQWPTLLEVFWFALMGGAISLAHFTMMKGLKLADVSALEPFRFSRLLFAAIIGFILFKEVPDVWTWVGGGMLGIAMVLATR